MVMSIKIDEMMVYWKDAAKTHICDFLRDSTIYYDVIFSQDNVSMKKDIIEQV